MVDIQQQEYVGLLTLERILDARLTSIVTSPVPAAGADISLTVPGGVNWVLIAFQAQLATAVAVANRTPVLDIADADGTSRFRFDPVITQAASLTGVYRAAAGMGAYGPAGSNTFPLPTPPLVLPSSFRVRTVTTNIQAADQWSAISLWVLAIAPTRLQDIIKSLSRMFTGE